MNRKQKQAATRKAVAKLRNISDPAKRLPGVRRGDKLGWVTAANRRGIHYVAAGQLLYWEGE